MTTSIRAISLTLRELVAAQLKVHGSALHDGMQGRMTPGTEA
jgi:hypothetical protein